LNIDTEELRFPSGRSVGQAKKDASRLAAARSITHTEALDLVCAENGCLPPWSTALAELKRTGGYAYRCFCCNETGTRGNTLTIVSADFQDGSEERVHLACAGRDSRYAFCRFCGDSKVFLAEDINDSMECEEHAGESLPDYPDDDGDSYIENVRNRG
jgi:hypothetical protein